MANPFPDLQIYSQSGLTFPWAWLSPEPSGPDFSIHAGPDGIGGGMTMIIRWQDMCVALPQLLGYSWRDVNEVTGMVSLRRELPWQHPFFNQLWVSAITQVKGVQSLGTSFGDATDLDHFSTPGGGTGIAADANTGPWAEFSFAYLVIQFWRPPYYVLADSAVTGEWQRYVDKKWTIEANLLVRERNTYEFSTISPNPTSGPGQAPPARPLQFTAAIGIGVTKNKVSRRWYQLPERGLFANANQSDISAASLPNGLPLNFQYTQTPTDNLATGYGYQKGSPITFCVNGPIGGSGVTWNEESLWLFGCYPGTLRLDAVELIPRPLQMPPYLMLIPSIASNEAIAQQQYDAVLHYTIFDPPKPNYTSTVGPYDWVPRGHNLVPYSGNGLFYCVQSQYGADAMAASNVNPALTPYHFADLSDTFQIL